MPIPTSEISFSAIRDELGLTSGPFSIDQANFRQLAKGSAPSYEHTPVPGSQISLSEFSGKALGGLTEFSVPGTYSFTLPLCKTLIVEVFGAGGGGSGAGRNRTVASGESTTTVYDVGSPGTDGTLTSISMPTGTISAGAGTRALAKATAAGTSTPGSAGLGSGGNTSNLTGGGSSGGAAGVSGASSQFNGAVGGTGGYARSDILVSSFSPGTTVSLTIGTGGVGGAGYAGGGNGDNGRIRLTWT